MRYDFTLKIGEKVMRFAAKKMKGHWGYAYKDTNLIELSDELGSKSKFLQTRILIHEVLHLLNWDWTEEKIDKMSRIIARAIRKAKIYDSEDD